MAKILSLSSFFDHAIVLILGYMKDFFGNEKKSYNLSLLLISFAHRVQSSLTYQIKSNVIQKKLK